MANCVLDCRYRRVLRRRYMVLIGIIARISNEPNCPQPVRLGSVGGQSHRPCTDAPKALCCFSVETPRVHFARHAYTILADTHRSMRTRNERTIKEGLNGLFQIRRPS